MTGLRRLVEGAYPGHPSLGSLPDTPVRGIECDSRKVEPGFLFVAVRGARLDGSAFIGEAERRGALAVAGENAAGTKLPFIKVDDTRQALARLAGAFYGHPTRKMKLAGVTGTNGKTTVTYLVESLLSGAGLSAGVIGTVSYRYPGVELPAVETTPGPLALQRLFADMEKAGCRTAVMEVSSHALDQGRTEGLAFAAAAFTNLTQDHLDYHGSMQKYFESKVRLFQGLAPEAAAVLNADDAWCMKARALTRARVRTYSIDRVADLEAQEVRPEGDSTRFELAVPGGRFAVELPLIGRHNIYNALAALALAEELGVPLRRGAELLRGFKGVPGRLEAVRCGQDFSVLVDFAHTPDGLENVLKALSEHRSNRLLVVFGCGGDRDRAKRPRMAEIASRWADHVFVTSDNPRSEDPRAIAEEICAGFVAGNKTHSVILDRRKAIRQALLTARSGDIVLLAGKGHERAQIVGDQAIPFSDREEAERVLNGR